jgi:arginine/lysine/ornithine decarboxylase
MQTPICDFVKKYAKDKNLRLHMPGHKGNSFLGIEEFDITEVRGADSLYEASGIIAQSEKNASEMFGFPTFYSTEGSSQCIRAMLYLAVLLSKKRGESPVIAATRNAHKTFLTAAALLDFMVQWIYPESDDSYLSYSLSPKKLDDFLTAANPKPTAVYLTTPDYLGGVYDVLSLKEVCLRHGVLLLIDNAHGAYLKFLEKSVHPIDLGADMCCDSAHKTLPTLTGGAYLHLSEEMMSHFKDDVKNALMIFGSTSPSYVILQSLDITNVYLEKLPSKLKAFLCELDSFKKSVLENGYCLCSPEPLKVTIHTKPYGYTGDEFADILRQNKIEVEFSDPDYVVMMFTPEISLSSLDYLKTVLCNIKKRAPIDEKPPRFVKPSVKMSPREAMFSPSETLPIDECVGRILAVPTVACPPAVPILVCGEEIDKTAVALFKYYKIDNGCVVK